MYTLTIAGDKIVGFTVHDPHMEFDMGLPMANM